MTAALPESAYAGLVPFPEHSGVWCGAAYLSTYGVPAGTPVVLSDFTTAGLTAGISAASSGSGLLLVNRDITFTGTIDLVGVTLYSTTGATLTGAGTNDWIRIGTGGKVYGIEFRGYRPLRLKSATALSGGVVVACCDFIDCNIGIYDSSTADNTVHTGLTFERNYFSGCGYAMYMQRTSSSFFYWSKAEGSTNRNVHFVGGSSNHIMGWRIDEGITGINFLLSAAMGYAAGSMLSNDVEYNHITRITEEGIGGDVQGNTASEIAVFDQFIIESTSGTAASNPTIQVPRAGTFDPYRYYVVFQTGNLKGRYARLQATMTQVDVDSVSFKLDNNSLTAAQWALVAAGDRCSIGQVVALTKVHRNWVEMEGAGVAVSIYGNNFDWLVYSNVLIASDASQDAVRVTSLAGLITSSKFTNNNDTGNKTCAPVDGNVVVHNTIPRGRLRLRGKTYNSQANSYLIGTVYSNPVRNNIANVVNSEWDDLTNTGTFSPAPSDSAVQTNNSAYSAAQLGAALRPKRDGTYHRAGVSYLATSGVHPDFHGRRRRLPANLGAF